MTSGTYHRYKEENERGLFEVLGLTSYYDSVKDNKITLTIDIQGKGNRTETYQRGDHSVITTVKDGKIEMNMGYGKVVQKSVSDMKDGGFEYELDGVKRITRREVKNDDEFVMHHEFSKGDQIEKCMEYYKKV